MSKKKYLYTLVACFVILSSTHAQLYKIELADKAANATLVAEGRVIAQKCFWNETRNMIYTANTVEVYKTFKGAVTTSTIEVLTQGGSVGTRAVEVSDLLTLHTGQTGIFFCYENVLNIKSPSRAMLFDVYSSDQGFLRYNYTTNTATAPFARYTDIENNLYSLIENLTGETKKVVNAGFSVGKMLKMSSRVSSNGIGGTLAPAITSFSPAIVNAGALNDPANSTLTIHGSGFGDSPGGSAGVNFTDGNSDNSPPDYSVPYNSPYIVSWSNTTIVVKVPTRAATGSFSVVLNDGATTATSPTPLTVNFSVLNFVFDFSSVGVDTVVASEPRLMNANGQGGYTYRFSTDTAGSGINFATSDAVATFNRAVNTWKEIVGANLTAGANTTVQKVDDDEVNIVEYDNKNTGVPPMAAGVLEVTYSFGSTCFVKTPFLMYTPQKSGFDILIRNPAVSKGNAISFSTGPCFPAIGSYDLENIILHEIGHALNLAHINDGYEASPNAYANVNPAKVMHYSIIDYADRRSPDNSAYTGALYAVTPQDDVFGSCGLYPGQMLQLHYTSVTNDECPAAFPASATLKGTRINFDLVHATSNKLKDPAFTQVNCLGNGTFVTNNAYYAIKTSATSNGTLSVNISNYTTTPAELASCAGQGIRLSVYQVSACPVGQSYPAPVTCTAFTGNGTVADITGLAPNTSYLLYFDGLRNTKATFTVTLNGTALPITLSKFTGEYIHGFDNLYIEIEQAINVKNIAIEKSRDGNNFAQLGFLNVSSPQELIGKHTYIDAQPYAGKNYYRLKITDNDGKYQYSNIIVLQNTLNQLTYVYPNPARNNAYISISGVPAGRYACIVYDAGGKAILSNNYNLTQSIQTISVPLSGIAGGVYLIRIVNSSGKTIAQQKLVKE
ncbi:MAG TPA: T9SS type A sorting domain-containing protein [Chitinophagaceae bacterium]|nr:T9SS type A sorting domain-containing protein [Chitinophagaceae bacterium]